MQEWNELSVSPDFIFNFAYNYDRAVRIYFDFMAVELSKYAMSEYFWSFFQDNFCLAYIKPDETGYLI